MKTVLITAICSRMDPWRTLMETSRQTWASVDVPGVDTVFHVGEPEEPWVGDYMAIGIKDTLFSMGLRNLLAFERVLAKPWDFLARVNASCYVHKQRLLDRCQELPTTGVFLGGRGNTDDSQPWLWGGLQYIISRDVVEALAANKDKWPERQMDDVGLSKMVLDLGFQFNTDVRACAICRLDHSSEAWAMFGYGGHSQTFSRFSELGEDNHFFYRVRQMTDRHIEPDIMRSLFRQHYPNKP